jgi:hypothetical protein
MKKNGTFNKAEAVCLTEIYRRLNYFHGGDMNKSLMYLALPSEAKHVKGLGLITIANGRELKGHTNWYKLTDKGKTFFSHYIEPVSNEDSEAYYNGSRLKQFDPKYL